MISSLLRAIADWRRRREENKRWLRESVEYFEMQEQVKSLMQAREERMLRPDWQLCEQRLQRPIPAGLREIYTDRIMMTSVGMYYPEVVESISCFEPLDQQALTDVRESLGVQGIIIARSQFGEPIFLRSGAAETDTVYILRDNEAEIEVLAVSVDSMIQKLRTENSAPS